MTQIDAADTHAIIDVIKRFGRSFDTKNWDVMADCLLPQIFSDYSRFRGAPASTLSREEYIRLRKRGLQGLVTTHANRDFDIDINGAEAVCICAFSIQRFTPDNVKFFHSYGRYVFTLQKQEMQWRISGITQIPERHEGDASIHGAFGA